MHAGAAAALVQEYENHGLSTPHPFGHGHLHHTQMAPVPRAALPLRPSSAPNASSVKAGKKATSGSQPPAIQVLHAHVRGKMVTVAVGPGQQTVYWLGLAAVQRYLRQPESTTQDFSHELTPRRVLAKGGGHRGVSGGEKGGERGEEEEASAPAEPSFVWLDIGARLCECGLEKGDHVWVDVGDGTCPPATLTVDRSHYSLPVPRSMDGKPWTALHREERPGAPVVWLQSLTSSTQPDASNITGV